jgi:hypothetical protein
MVGFGSLLFRSGFRIVGRLLSAMRITIRRPSRRKMRP